MLAFACKDQGSNLVPEPPISGSLDTLQTAITQNANMKLTGLKDSYDLREHLVGKITVTNVSDTNSLVVVYPIWPAWYLRVYDENGKYVGGGPDVLSFIEVRYQLALGQSYTYDVYWSKNTPSTAKYGIDLPAPVGKYLLSFGLDGNVAFSDKRLSKWVTISESDSPSCIAFKTTFDQWDLAILDFVIRNRYSTALTYHFQGNPIVTLRIVSYPDGQDTVYSDTLHFQNSAIVLEGRQDTLLFSYRLDKTLPQFATLNGTYKAIAHTVFTEREVNLSDFVVFVHTNGPAREQSGTRARTL